MNEVFISGIIYTQVVRKKYALLNIITEKKVFPCFLFNNQFEDFKKHEDTSFVGKKAICRGNISINKRTNKNKNSLNIVVKSLEIIDNKNNYLYFYK